MKHKTAGCSKRPTMMLILIHIPIRISWLTHTDIILHNRTNRCQQTYDWYASARHGWRYKSYLKYGMI
jgi:hypothetical protein